MLPGIAQDKEGRALAQLHLTAHEEYSSQYCSEYDDGNGANAANENDGANGERVASLPLHLVATDIMPRMEPPGALALAMTCKPMYLALFAHDPGFRDKHFGIKYRVAQCVREMASMVRHRPPNMLGFFFSQDWLNRYGSPLNRGHCMFIVKMREGDKSIYTINGRDATEAAALEFLWPRLHELELRTSCAYRCARRRECVACTSGRMTALLRGAAAKLMTAALP